LLGEFRAVAEEMEQFFAGLMDEWEAASRQLRAASSDDRRLDALIARSEQQLDYLRELTDALGKKGDRHRWPEVPEPCAAQQAPAVACDPAADTVVTGVKAQFELLQKDATRRRMKA